MFGKQEGSARLQRPSNEKSLDRKLPGGGSALHTVWIQCTNSIGTVAREGTALAVAEALEAEALLRRTRAASPNETGAAVQDPAVVDMRQVLVGLVHASTRQERQAIASGTAEALGLGVLDVAPVNEEHIKICLISFITNGLTSA